MKNHLIYYQKNNVLGPVVAAGEAVIHRTDKLTKYQILRKYIWILKGSDEWCSEENCSSVPSWGLLDHDSDFVGSELFLIYVAPSGKSKMCLMWMKNSKRIWSIVCDLWKFLSTKDLPFEVNIYDMYKPTWTGCIFQEHSIIQLGTYSLWIWRFNCKSHQ